MIAKAKRVYRGVGKATHGREWDDLHKIVVDQVSEDLGRTIAIHIMGRNYGVARLVIDRAEREWREEQEEPPMDLGEVTIEDLGLSERVYESLRAEPGMADTPESSTLLLALAVAAGWRKWAAITKRQRSAILPGIRQHLVQQTEGARHVPSLF